MVRQTDTAVGIPLPAVELKLLPTNTPIKLLVSGHTPIV
jgi:hypothetical protein